MKVFQDSCLQILINNLKIRDSATFETFKNHILSFARPMQNSVFKTHDLLRIKLLARLRIGLSPLKEDNFKHNFQDLVDHLHSCGNSI